MHLSLTCVHGRADSLYKVIDIIQIDRDKICYVCRGQIRKTKQYPYSPPEQNVIHNEQRHLRNKCLDTVPSDKESPASGHQVKQSRSSQVNDRHRQTYHHCHQRHNVATRGAFHLVLMWDDFLYTNLGLIYVYFTRFHIQFVNIANMPATAYGQLWSFLSIKRYALRRVAEPVRTSINIHMGTTTIIAASRIPNGLKYKDSSHSP